MTTAIMSPETAVIGLKYWDSTVGTGASSQLVWADWVNRQTADLAGAKRGGIWAERLELVNARIGLADLDRICDETGGERVESEDFTGRGGNLHAAGLAAVIKLASDRSNPQATALDIAETAAMCELEGTPLAPIAAYVRPTRRCAECGSMVYGDHCTHCHEG